MISRGLRYRLYPTDEQAERTQRGALRKFVEVVLSSNTNDCIEWPFATERQGYGVIRWGDRKQRPTHRVVLVESTGVDLPKPFDACHKCHNRRCINPRHLEWGTRRKNRADMLRDGTVLFGERNPQSTLTEEQVLAIRADPRKRSVVARAYGIHPQTVYMIIKRKRWVHLK